MLLQKLWIRQVVDFGEITMDTAQERPEPIDLDDVNTDIVIIGGGPAGLSAAISAKESGAENVILVEKLDILSGNGKFSMDFYDPINSKAKKITIDGFIQMKKDTMDSDKLIYAWAKGSAGIDEWFRNMGIELNYAYGKTNHMAEKYKYAGEHIQDQLEEKANNFNIDIRTGTKDLDLIMDGDQAIGVEVENKEGYYDINAGAVIVVLVDFHQMMNY